LQLHLLQHRHCSYKLCNPQDCIKQKYGCGDTLYYIKKGGLTFFFLPAYCSLSEDIQQLCWRSLLMACRRYIQWYICYLSSITIDWCLAPHR
jgi:hypothetical protein